LTLSFSKHRVTGAVLGVAALALALVPFAAGAATDGKYLVPIGDEYETQAILSVGDRVPETSNPAREYQMVGIPDGLGAYEIRGHDDDDGDGEGDIALFVNHEFTNGVVSEPTIGQPLNRGAIVSKYLLDEDGEVISGERAYDSVYQENTLLGPAAEVGNTTPAFGRFCSASLAGRQFGFDRNIFFTSEEADGANTFDGKGGQTVAVFDNKAFALPKLGHFAKENSLVMRGTGSGTVILSLEDGPSGPDSQLYMYVGRKDRSAPLGSLARNGLDNGDLYVFAGNDPAKNSELGFQSGSTTGRWVRILGAETMTDVQLEAAADAAGAFGFVRIEDGAFNKQSTRDFYFVTTGGNKDAGNELGRLYHLRFDRSDPTDDATLKVVYNADAVIAAGEDIAVSPDNIDTSKKYLMIQEDGTSQSRPIMQGEGRDAGIWRFEIDGSKVDADDREFVAELDPPGRDGIPVPVSGTWESSGIIDASRFLGRDTWFVDVQAHSPTTAPGVNTVEDGQILIMTPADGDSDEDD
jgi:hypothetical protein